MKTACLQVLINRIHYSLAGGGHMMNRTVTPASPCIHCTYDISSCLASRGSMSHLLLALVCHWSRLPDGKHHWLPRMFVTVCIIKLCVSLLRMFVTLCDLLLIYQGCSRCKPHIYTPDGVNLTFTLKMKDNMLHPTIIPPKHTTLSPPCRASKHE